MARVAIMLVGGQDRSEASYGEALAVLGARLDVISIGPIVRKAGASVVVLTVQTSMGPAHLDGVLEGLGLRLDLAMDILSYGALIYRSSEVDVPPRGVGRLDAALRSLAEADPGFEIPGLGNVTTHLQDVSNRQR